MKGYRNRSLVTKIALYISLVFGAVWMFTFVVGAFVEKEPITGEGVLLTAIVLLILFGVTVAIIYSGKKGGVLVIIFSIILCIFAYVTAGRNKIFAVLISGVPFLISGILFLLGDKIDQNT